MAERKLRLFVTITPVIARRGRGEFQEKSNLRPYRWRFDFGSTNASSFPRLRPERLDARTDQHRRIRALPRNELLRASVINLGGVQIALLVHVHAVNAPEAAWEIAERAP